MGVMFEFFWNLDLSVFKFINQTLSFGWLDQTTPILTNLDQFLWFKIGFPLIAFTFFFKKYHRLGIIYFLFLVLSVSTSDFIGGRVKKIVLRPRPFQIAETQTLLKAPAKEDRSFYSNHASNTFTAATYLTAFFPAGQIYFFTSAGLIALTRVHVGVHYPSDILTGAIMGLLWGFLFSRLVQFLTRQFKEK